MNRARLFEHQVSLRASKRRSTATQGERKQAAAGVRARHTASKMANKRLEERIERLAAAAAHPLAELLECPEEAGQLLTSVSRCINVDAGEAVFRQNGSCKGLYVVVSGDFVRKAERLQMRVTLGTARPGDLVEPGIPRIRRERGPFASDDDLLLAAFYSEGQYKALKAAGPIDTDYPLASTPLITLLKEIALRPGIRSFHLIKRPALA